MNSLKGLLTEYGSDSETEEGKDEVADNNKVDSPITVKDNSDSPNPMADKFADFMKEIDNIHAPSDPTVTHPPNTTTPSTVIRGGWQECFDESSGYTYYWHTETNDVTWDIPEEFVKYYEHQMAYLEHGPPKKRRRSKGDEKKKAVFPSYATSPPTSPSQTNNLITDPNPTTIGPQLPSIPIVGPQPLIGPVPPIPPIGLYVGPIVLKDKPTVKTNREGEIGEGSPSVSVLKLVEYGDGEVSDEEKGRKEEENENGMQKDPPPDPSPEVKYSRRKRTLDVKAKPTVTQAWNSTYNPHDKSGNHIRKGFGFEQVRDDSDDVLMMTGETESSIGKSNNKSETTGGYGGKISFVKSETLFEKQEQESKDSPDDDRDEDLNGKTTETLERLKVWKDDEHEDQINNIIAQTEILLCAYRARALLPSFLSQWLETTCSATIQDNETTINNNWKCFWDSTKKEYTFEHIKTGLKQNEKPVIKAAVNTASTNTRSEEIEHKAPPPPICPPPPPFFNPPPPPSPNPTEPPPPGDEDLLPLVPPAPPRITSFSSSSSDSDSSENSDMEIDSPPPPPPPMSPPPAPPPPPPSNEEDSQEAKAKSAVDCALDLFYSELQSEEKVPSPPTPPQITEALPPSPPTITQKSMVVTNTIVKSKSSSPKVEEKEKSTKKKKKPKLNSGISLKKKGVTSLVAKWQEMQKDLNKYKDND